MKTMRELVCAAMEDIAKGQRGMLCTTLTPLQQAFTDDDVMLKVLLGTMEHCVNGGIMLALFTADPQLRDIIRLALVIGLETGRLIERHGVVEQAEEKCQ